MKHWRSLLISQAWCEVKLPFARLLQTMLKGCSTIHCSHRNGFHPRKKKVSLFPNLFPKRAMCKINSLAPKHWV